MDETPNTTPHEPSRENPHELPKAKPHKTETPKTEGSKTEGPKTTAGIDDATIPAGIPAAILRGGTSRYPRSMARLRHLAHGR